MKKIEKSDIWLFLVQAAVWAVVITALPLATFLSTHNWETTSTSLLLMWQEFRGPLIVYFINFYIFGPFSSFGRSTGSSPSATYCLSWASTTASSSVT